MPGPVTTEVLRFAVVRPSHSTGVTRVDSGELAGEKAAVVGQPASPAAEATALEKAEEEVKTARSDEQLQRAIRGLVLTRAEVLLRPPKTIAEARATVRANLETHARGLDVNRELVKRLRDFLVASAVLNRRGAAGGEGPSRDEISAAREALQACAFVMRVNDRKVDEKSSAADALAVLRGVVVLPAVPRAHPAAAAPVPSASPPVDRAAVKSREISVAAEELLSVYRTSQNKKQFPAKTSKPASYRDGILQKALRAVGITPVVSIPRTAEPAAAEPWRLTDDHLQRLSKTSQGAVQDLVNKPWLNLKGENVFTVVNILDAIANQECEDSDSSNLAPVIGRFGATELPLRKLAAVQAGAAPSGDAGTPSARPLGFIDLNLVKQTHVGYEPGEIAHIENVLAKEERLRDHTRREETEVTTTQETFEDRAEENYLSSTDRFELEREVGRSTSEQLGIQAGVTVSAQYGPTVEVQASVGLQYQRSQQETNQSSSRFGREVVNRTVSHIEKSERRARVERVLRVISERNKHAINGLPDKDSVAVYRWINKVCEVEIVNYGKRLAFEFYVPEPAVALLKRLQSASVVDVSKPVPMAYRADQITPCNYLKLAHQYQVSDLQPPPPRFKTVSFKWANTNPGSYHSPHPERMADVIALPDGYRPMRAHVRFNHYPESVVSGQVSLTLGSKVVLSPDFGWYWPERDSVEEEVDLSDLTEYSGGLATTAMLEQSLGIAVAIDVVCERTTGANRLWQLSVYEALIGGYRARLSEYNEALAEARLQAGSTNFGQPPEVNLATIRNELKKSSIELLRRQVMNFGAVQLVAGQAGGDRPQLDFVKADGQSPIVEFYEQAFEWAAMTYVFYPYFWARPEMWDVFALASDPDLTFQEFLRAGAARLVVPVRPEFEEMMKNYIARYDRAERERIWITDAIAADGSSNPDALPADVFPVWAELADSLGRPHVEGKAVGKVTKGSSTLTGVTGRALIPTPASPSDGDIMYSDDNREVYINGERYVIKLVADGATAELRDPYRGTTDAKAELAFGHKVIDGPWRIKLPTSLIALESGLKQVPTSVLV